MRPVKIGGFFRIPELERDENGQPIFERKGPAPPEYQTSNYKGSGEIWFVSTPQDREYFRGYMDKKRAHREAQARAKKSISQAQNRDKA